MLTIQLIYNEDEAAEVGFSAPCILDVDDVASVSLKDILEKEA
jgi:hypothetical protein